MLSCWGQGSFGVRVALGFRVSFGVRVALGFRVILGARAARVRVTHIQERKI